MSKLFLTPGTQLLLQKIYPLGDVMLFEEQCVHSSIKKGKQLKCRNLAFSPKDKA